MTEFLVCHPIFAATRYTDGWIRRRVAGRVCPRLPNSSSRLSHLGRHALAGVQVALETELLEEAERVSYLTISQWKVAALNPPHLKAICPWEGLSDLYKDLMYPRRQIVTISQLVSLTSDGTLGK